jgi:LysR family hydrogen peroxide-inducible transcriptional activator
MRLSDTGKRFLERAKRVLRELEEARLEVKEQEQGEIGAVTLGAPPSNMAYFVPPMLKEFWRLHPKIRVNVVEDWVASLLQGLRAGALDMAVLELPIRGREFTVRELYRERLCLAVPRAHKLASRTEVSLKEVHGEPFLLLKEGMRFRETALAACHKAGVEPNVVFETGQFTAIVAMVAAEMGMSLVPEMAVRQDSGCRFVPVKGQERRIGIVRMRSTRLAPAQQKLAEHMETAARKVQKAMQAGA